MDDPETYTSQLPSGTLTFLFTDIEGSTRLWEQFPEQMRQAHARHGELVIACVEQHGGTFVRTRGEGDSTFSVFAQAADALAAACAFQLALAAEPWPQRTPIRVRAALHTGVANLKDSDYNSSDVNRCARLRSIAHGAQTVLSQTVYDLAAERLPEGITLKDLGLHRLKDLSRPEHVYQLCHPALPADFPPLISLNPVMTNLPPQLTSFIGREAEMEQIRQLLQTTRLLTLTGAGGCGKTRLSLQIGADLADTYPDGVWLVELAALTDPALVPQTAASALGVREQPDIALLQTLTDSLRTKTLLLVLDNCEHLVEACARLADTLLHSCPQVKILATSREALNISGERTYRVPSLLQPDLHDLPLEEKELAIVLLEYDAIRLFVERARSHASNFALNRRNGLAVAEICSRLDGIPLAIELAAARTRALTVEQIAARLNDRFQLLTGGSRMALPRQQTLRALIDWSYDLLSREERLLLQRLSVFAGGWTLEAAEFVCTRKDEGGRMKDESNPIQPSSFILHPSEILDPLTSLVDKSLVLFEQKEEETVGRYRLLETIREYARQKLQQETAEEAVWRDRHLQFYLQMAEEAEKKLTGEEQAEWLQRLETEHDNLRAALAWSLEMQGIGNREQGIEISAEGERGREGEGEKKQSSNLKSQVSGLILAGAMAQFWDIHGYWSEGREHLQAALAQQAAGQRTAARSKALNGAGNLARLQGDYVSARALLEECLAIDREAGDKAGISVSLNNLGIMAWQQGDYAAARALYEEGLAMDRESGDKWGIAASLSNLGSVVNDMGDFAVSRDLYEESLALFRELGDKRGIAILLNNLGNVAVKQGDYAAAKALSEESLELLTEFGDKNGVSASLNNLGNVAEKQGDLARARALHEDSLVLRREIGDKQGIAQSLQALAALAEGLGEFVRAVRMWAAAEALLHTTGATLPPHEQEESKRKLESVRSSLGEPAFSAAWEAGRAMTCEQAVEYALQDHPKQTQTRSAE